MIQIRLFLFNFQITLKIEYTQNNAGYIKFGAHGLSYFIMDDSSFITKELSFSPNYSEDFLQDDVFSSPISYPQINWYNDDPYNRKETYTDFSLNIDSDIISSYSSILPLPIILESSSSESKPKAIQPIENSFKKRPKKKKVSTTKSIPFSQIFHPFENSL